MKPGAVIKKLDVDEIKKYVDAIEAEKAAEAEKEKAKIKGLEY